jgi:hypothetical protein
MKKSVLSVLLVAASIGAQAQVVSFKYGSEVIPSGGLAGAVLAANWNSAPTAFFPPVSGSGLLDNSGAVTTISFTLTTPQGWGGWQIGGTPSQDADSSYNKLMLNQYLNSATAYGNPESLSLSGVTYGQYDLYVYFSSDAAGRTGTINLGSTTFDFSTVGAASIAGANALLAQTTSTSGLNPTANYAVFSGITGGAQTVNLDIPFGGGISGFQVVAVPEPSTLALAGLSLIGLAIRQRVAKS